MLPKDWHGPYVIVKPLNGVVYRIHKPGGRFKVVHVDWQVPRNGDHNSNHNWTRTPNLKEEVV